MSLCSLGPDLAHEKLTVSLCYGSSDASLDEPLTKKYASYRFSQLLDTRTGKPIASEDLKHLSILIPATRAFCDVRLLKSDI